MNNSVSRQVESMLSGLGLYLTEEQIEQLSAYLGELELWNPRYKLMAARTRAEIISRHIADSLAPWKMFASVCEMYSGEKPLQVADIGSGNGMPGIPLAIVFPQVHVSLIERSAKRAGFLRNALAVTGLLPRAAVVQQDIGALNSRFDILVFRAFRPLPEVIRQLEDLLAQRGVMFAYKSRGETLQQELDEIERSFPDRYETQQVPYRLPGVEADRRICLVARAGLSLKSNIDMLWQ
ncbi:MAG: 16S rRNA (guanine(527)-N(7))-methyltransferase RsmG [Spirochaetota bacterium]